MAWNKAFLIAVVLSGFASDWAAAQSVEWVMNTNSKNPRPTCLQLCQDSPGNNNIAVRAGEYKGNPYYVCAAEAEGLRPGFQITNSSQGTGCDISHDGHGKSANVAACLCSSSKVSAK